MDLLSAALSRHVGSEAFVLSSSLAPPWSIRIEDQASMTLLIVEAGAVWIVSGGRPVRLGPGDVALIRMDEPYLIGDSVDSEPLAVIAPGQLCRPLAARAPVIDPADGTWCTPTPPTTTEVEPDTEADIGTVTRFVVAIYERAEQIQGSILDVVPAVIRVPAGQVNAALIELLRSEAAAARPGRSVILDRLVDLLLVDTLRTWFDAAGPGAPGWWRGSADPMVSRALRLMHALPEQAWNVASLAADASVSRATFARRFTDVIGQAPISYLTDVRLDTAAYRLRVGADSIERVARDVGYANPYAFSTAFKRRFGQSPRQYRRLPSG